MFFYEQMGEFISRVAAVCTAEGPSLDDACFPRVNRHFGESDYYLRERWFRTFDISPAKVLVENEHLHRQVKELQAALNDKENLVRELRRTAERLGRVAGGDR